MVNVEYTINQTLTILLTIIKDSSVIVGKIDSLDTITNISRIDGDRLAMSAYNLTQEGTELFTTLLSGIFA